MGWSAGGSGARDEGRGWELSGGGVAATLLPEARGSRKRKNQGCLCAAQEGGGEPDRHRSRRVSGPLEGVAQHLVPARE